MATTLLPASTMQDCLPVSAPAPERKKSGLSSQLQEHQAAQAQALAAGHSKDSMTDTDEHTPHSAMGPSPAGAIARSLSIPNFPPSSTTNGVAGNGSASAGGASHPPSGYNTPSKRHRNSSSGSSSSSSANDHSAMRLMQLASQPSTGMAAGGYQSPPTSPPESSPIAIHASRMSPGQYYRPNPSNSGSNGSSSHLQKRRNSGTMGLQLSPMTNGQAMPGTRRPPAYPSNPSTPALIGRSQPINIGSGGKSSTGGGSGTPMQSPPEGKGSIGAMTPPGTPPVLPVPRAMLPASPLTPALGPERSIALTNSQGAVVERVSSSQLASKMDEVSEAVVLPPAAAVQQGKHHHHGHHHGHRGSAASAHKPRHAHVATHTPTAAQVQPAPQHSPPSSGSLEPVSAPLLTHITPVKHLVKLSSLSSLSSLIMPAAGGKGNTSPSSAAATPVIPSQPQAQLPTPNSAKGEHSPSSSPTPTMSPVSPNASPSPGPSSAGNSPTMGGSRAGELIQPPPSVPPTYIILDIDETIHINAHSPCLMMCEKGLELYQRIISAHANYRHVSYAAKSALTRTLQGALQSKRTVESGTSDLLNALQAANTAAGGSANIKIFGLTARFLHMAATTRKELLKLGIDLETSSPFPASVRRKVAKDGWQGMTHCGGTAGDKGAGSGSGSPSPSMTPSPTLAPGATPLGSSPAPMSALTLPASAASAGQQPQQEYNPDVLWTDAAHWGTDARYERGVIYTNACEKGPVLQRFLEYLWAKVEADNAEAMAHNEAVRAAHAQWHASATPPPGESPVNTPAGSSAHTPMLSHSLVHINRATTGPMSILSAASAAAASSLQMTPSPTDPATLTLLAAASKAQSRQSKRRPSQTTDHLLPPNIIAAEHHGSPMSPANMSPATPDALPGRSPSSPSGAPEFKLLPLNQLPSRLIFIDDRLQNVFSVYESLSAANLFDKFYNNLSKRSSMGHIPPSVEVYTCHYVPPELANHSQGPSNQTAADAAASAQAAPVSDPAQDQLLIETQIHHFLTHGAADGVRAILNDSQGRDMVSKIREQQQAAAAVLDAQREAEVRAAAAQLAGALRSPSPSKLIPGTNGANSESSSAGSSASVSGASSLSSSSAESDEMLDADEVIPANVGADAMVTSSTPRNVVHVQ